ncbi:protein-methionine-sulfoxide reductase catalytic subunit MsrP [Halieaceae bacterium IMCC14734]|uniref:Protein-methionine-sulfoxide reductase catalytic subunit MsrP n=1 Tax=Candidatus Litorirhabdus singularis TaxID=2518993 RepID=A0ABT3TP66_9GAMM|nr:protein-methionine-sulfoxide reductase catalytic subunit MsrP [Candidatus Litorirhabdus singularis]MCX2983189.1 protein-methionine-sulfoxide reductase catalytic subunit MsrP [Candidatus Litorirhabdus singularis]
MRKKAPYQPPSIPSSEITSESVWLKRRHFMSVAAGGLIAGAPLGRALAASGSLNYAAASNASPGGFYTGEKQTPFDDVTRYNNFYEFGTGKDDPASYAHEMSIDPWSLQVDGEVEKPGTLNLEDIQSGFDLEERVYRLRCVEAWSMVVPWVGYSLADLLKRFQPTSKAKYVQFYTLQDRKQMRGQRSFTSTIDWPYVEGLRMDEAMNPLTFMATGLYGKDIPNQNGAPIRLVVPWKYGFKSIKSIVRIRLTERRPKTTWEMLAPQEYGFYANVNPQVDHPRWSQKTERRLPSSLFSPNRIDTQMFNGYQEQVGHLYAGMDLKRFY